MNVDHNSDLSWLMIIKMTIKSAFLGVKCRALSCLAVQCSKCYIFIKYNFIPKPSFSFKISAFINSVIIEKEKL